MGRPVAHPAQSHSLALHGSAVTASCLFGIAALLADRPAVCPISQPGKPTLQDDGHRPTDGLLPAGQTDHRPDRAVHATLLVVQSQAANSFGLLHRAGIVASAPLLFNSAADGFFAR